MAQFKNMVITENGYSLIAKGTTIKFSKIVASDADMDEEDFLTSTSIPQIKGEGHISDIEIINNATVKVSGAISNMELASPYYVKIVGLYAIDPDDGEILYALSQAENPDVMPAYRGENVASIILNFIAPVASSDKVDITKDLQVTATIINIGVINKNIKNFNESLSEHTVKNIYTKDGFHGIRFYENTLQFYDDEWYEIQAGTAYPIGNVTGFAITPSDEYLEIKWSDPEDAVINGVPVDWKKTVLVRKVGAYPTDPTDGIIICDNRIRDAYKTDPFIDSGLTNGTKYYYQAFPYSTRGKVTIDNANRITGTPINRPIYGISIDSTNSNPSTSITYTDDAEGLTAGDPEWDDTDLFKDIKPCVLKNGAVQYYLNPNDFTKKSDGSSADITSGNDGDVMIEVPKMQYKISYQGAHLTVLATRTKSKLNGFCFYPFSREAEGDIDKIYYPAYLGCTVNTGTENEIIMSLSGKETDSESLPTTIITNLAKNRGENYMPFGFYHLTLLQVLYLLRYKNLNSQVALGIGLVGEMGE